MLVPLCHCSKEFIITEQVLSRPSWLRRCYDWTLAWATHPQAAWALFVIAVIEASVFPVPPDILLLALALAQPRQGLRFAAIATAGSVLGAVIGYAIGMFLFAAIAQPLLEFYHAMERFSEVQKLFVEYGAGIVLIAGFSPIPFKIITIAAGAFGLSFPLFLMAALLSRGVRFFIEGALLRWGGDSLRQLVEKHFEWLTVTVVVVVIGGFALLWL